MEQRPAATHLLQLTSRQPNSSRQAVVDVLRTDRHNRFMRTEELFAHSANSGGEWEPLSTHLKRVSKECAQYCQVFNAAPEGALLGWLHDIGKVGQLFQERLHGRATGVDHWSPGAALALANGFGEKNRARALIIEGHHIGLQRADSQSLIKRIGPYLDQRHPPKSESGTPSVFPLAKLHQALKEVGLHPPVSQIPAFVPEPLVCSSPARAMLRIRMLFSALVDADYRMTELHFLGKESISEAPSLDPDHWLAGLDLYRSSLQNRPQSPEMLRLREWLFQSAISAASHPHRMWTLTAPTGSGKTLAMLKFALEHAKHHNLRRIVFVLPYLALLQQTVQVLREILTLAYPNEEDSFLDTILVEDHSLVQELSAQSDTGASEAVRRSMTADWQAPLIVTTNVQLLESLHSRHPSSCRKLHRLSRSVILLDEIQTLPIHLSPITLATLGSLAEDFCTSIVFSTATQPAFQSLADAAAGFGGVNWRPVEITGFAPHRPPVPQRVRVSWHCSPSQSWSLEQLAARLAHSHSALCIVNTKRQARAVFELVRRIGSAAMFLATSLCPAHRRLVLEQVRSRLAANEPCLLVSTQCVEAGVDLDFPLVLRMIAPLDAIAQAAGRCNRNGARTEPGEVIVFSLDGDLGDLYPDALYREAAKMTRQMLHARHGTPDLTSEDLFTAYFQQWYQLLPEQERIEDLRKAVQSLDFPEIERSYRLIEQRQISVLVPFDRDLFAALRTEALEQGISARWIRQARQIAVGIFPPGKGAPVWSSLMPVRTKYEREIESWHILADDSLYDPVMGLLPVDKLSLLDI